MDDDDDDDWEDIRGQLPNDDIHGKLQGGDDAYVLEFEHRGSNLSSMCLAEMATLSDDDHRAVVSEHALSDRSVASTISSRTDPAQPHTRGMGSFVNARDSEGLTPLLHAARSGNARMLELLIDHGAENAQDAQGMNALMIATKMGHFEAVEVLLQAHARGRFAASHTPTAEARNTVHAEAEALMPRQLTDEEADAAADAHELAAALAQVAFLEQPAADAVPLLQVQGPMSGHWLCTVCTLQNSNRTATCDACLSVRADANADTEMALLSAFENARPVAHANGTWTPKKPAISAKPVAQLTAHQKVKSFRRSKRHA